MNKLKQMAEHITNSLMANLSNKVYFDYQDDKEAFKEFMLEYISPALNEASERFVSHKNNKAIQRKNQAKLDAIVESLQKWCKERNLTAKQQNENLLGNVLEELTELTRAKTDSERIDALCDIVVYTINAYGDKFRYEHYTGYDTRNKNELFNFIRVATQDIQCNAHTHIAYMCFGSMRQLGYDPFKAMNETIKEISSRSGKWNKKLGKFVKDAGVYGDKQSLLEFEENIKAAYPDDNVVFDYRDNEVDVNIDYGKTIITYKLWYKADYDKCKLEERK